MYRFGGVEAYGCGGERRELGKGAGREKMLEIRCGAITGTVIESYEIAAI